MDLTDAYANAAYIPDGTKYPDRWAAAAQGFRDTVPGQIGLAYGPGPREVFDLFQPAAPEGLVVFIHGGYWRAFDRTMWSHLAAGPLAQGWAVALPSYDLCPDVRISDITRQVARAIDRIAERVAGPIVLTGHSAGGHLVARLACSDMELGCRDRIVHVMPVSAISDLAPLIQTGMNSDLRIDLAEALAESPLRHSAPDVPVTIWVGGDERPAFLDQSRWLSDAWQSPLVVAPDRHHFDVIGDLALADSAMVANLLHAKRDRPSGRTSDPGNAAPKGQ